MQEKRKISIKQDTNVYAKLEGVAAGVFPAFSVHYEAAEITKPILL